MIFWELFHFQCVFLTGLEEVLRFFERGDRRRHGEEPDVSASQRVEFLPHAQCTSQVDFMRFHLVCISTFAGI